MRKTVDDKTNVQRWSDNGCTMVVCRRKDVSALQVVTCDPHCQSYFATYCDTWIGNSSATNYT